MLGLERKNIAIIGSGGIGSRHFQALLKNNFPSLIQIFDPNENSIELSKKIFKESEFNNNIKVEFYKSFVKNSFNIDLLIIATLSDIRSKVFSDFISINNVSNIIFEKVVFQSSDQFSEVIETLEQNSIKAWVNCPNRTNKGYINFKNQLNLSSPLKFSVSGSNWNLASNLIHYIDLFCFFIGNLDIKIDGSKLDNKIYESKRNSFIELGGTIKVLSKNSDLLLVSDLKDRSDEVVLTLSNSDNYLKVFESKNYALIKDKNNSLSKIDFPIEYQSNLTNLIANDILYDDICLLTDIRETSIIHKKIFNLVNNHIEMCSGEKINLCPIT